MRKTKNNILISLLVLIIVMFVSPFLFQKTSEVLADSTDSISKEMLSVKCQLKENENGSADIRLVSTVDSLEAYNTAGFDIYVERDGVVELLDRYEKTYVTETIGARTEGVSFAYNPKVFDTRSNYFVTVTIINIPESAYDNGFLIRPFVTMAGETERVYGTSRYVKVNDVLADVACLSVPVVQLTETSGYSIMLGETVYSSGIEFYTDTVNDGNYTHLRIKTDSTQLKSVTKVKVLSEYGEEVRSTLYRNLRSTSSEADTTWYEQVPSDTTSYTIVTTADLYGLASVVNGGESLAGCIVYLGADITVNTGDATDWAQGNDLPSNVWVPIGGGTNSRDDSKYFSGIFDGQGQTISGLYMNIDGRFMGLFGLTSADGSYTSTIRNVKLTNGYLKSTATDTHEACGLGSVIGRGEGTVDMVYSDIILEGASIFAGGLVGTTYRAGSQISVTNSWYDGMITTEGTVVGGILGFVKYFPDNITDTYLTDCLVTADLTGGTFVGGLAGYSTGGRYLSGVVIGNISGEKTRGYVGNHIGTGTLEIVKCYHATDAMLDYEYGTIQPILTNSSRLTEEQLIGEEVYSNTLLDFYDKNTNTAGRWVIITNGFPELQCLVKSEYMDDLSKMEDYSMPITSDTAWYNVMDQEFIINTAEELYGLAEICNTGIDTFKGKTIVLGSDIQVNKGKAENWNERVPTNAWIPIGLDTDRAFAGTFNGNGHTISGIYLKADNKYLGLFGVLNTESTAVVRDLRLVNCYMECTATSRVGQDHGLGSIAGQGCGVLQNIYSEAVLVNASTNTGGLVGSVVQDSVTLDVMNCWFVGSATGGTGDTTSAYDWVGGIVGYVGINEPTTNLTNCLVAAQLSSQLISTTTESKKGVSFVGGLCGRILGGNIQSCMVYGSVACEWGYSRSIAGMTTRAGLSIKQCYNATNRSEIYYNVAPGVIEVLRLTDYGGGSYQLTNTSTTYDDYCLYLLELEEHGFSKYAENVLNQTDNDSSQGVWNATYTKEEIIISVIHVAKTGRSYITINKGIPVSEHLVYQENYLLENQMNAKTILHMPELYSDGDSFIIQLKNGHFILLDGGTSYDALYLLDYLEELTGGEKPIIEAWFISHGHGDHNGVLMSFVDNPSYAERIYVEGVYFSEPNSTVGTEEDQKQITKSLEGVLNCSTVSGETTPVFRPQTGQRFYYCDITIDILHTQEQLPLADYGNGYGDNGNVFNDSSTWILCTIENQTFLHAGDAAEGSIAVVKNSYHQEFLEFDIMATFHHGQNVYTDYIDYFKYKTVLYTTFVTASQTANHRVSENEILQMNAKNNGGECLSWGDGTKILTFPYVVGEATSLALRTWTYHPDRVTPVQR